MPPENNSIQEIRDKLLNRTLVVISLTCLPALLASLLRVEDIGWKPAMTCQITAVFMVWITTIWRHSISFQTKTFLLIGSLFMVGTSAALNFGLSSSGLLVFFTANILATILFGARWGWITLAVTLSITSITALAVTNGLISYNFDLNAYAVNPSSWLLEILLLALVCSIVTALLGKFHSVLLEIVDESNTRAENLAQQVAERKHAEQAKRESEGKFQRIIENIPDVYFETGYDGTINYCSPSCIHLFGYSQEELLGKKTEMLYHNPIDRELLIGALRDKGSVGNMELIFKKKNGDLYDVSINATPYFDKNGTLTGLSGTIRDITESKKAKEQIQRSRKMEAIGLMAGGVAHDLNNILAGIVSYPELLLMKLPVDSDLRKPIETIKDSGYRAASVVADFLTVAKGTASTREFHDLHALIQQHAHSPECERLQQLFPHVSYQYDLHAPHANLSCSPVHIKKCLMNILNNAVEAIVDRGTVTLSTVNQTINTTLAGELNIRKGEYIILSVTDTGPGIAKNSLDRIFEPFYTKKIMGRSGTGLGLAIVWNTMQDHGGTVQVQSNENGTCFQLYFPLAQEPQKNVSRKIITENTHGNGEHILVVDDEANLRDIAAQILTAHGYTVDVVSSGEEAIAFVQKESIDLLILDMLMEPGINGRQTYEEINKIYPGQKAIIASGFSETEDVEAALQQGIGNFIKKPYAMNKLCLAVRNELDR